MMTAENTPREQIGGEHRLPLAIAAILLFALAFVAVFMIIVDLDRPQEGLLTVSQVAMTDLLQQMTVSSP